MHTWNHSESLHLGAPGWKAVCIPGTTESLHLGAPGWKARLGTTLNPFTLLAGRLYAYQEPLNPFTLVLLAGRLYAY